MTTLRQAAQQALEAMDQLHRTGDTQVFDLCHKETTEALRAALAEPVQEPVAWMHPGYMGEPTISRRLPEYGGGNQWEPLYTAPPQRKPIDVDALGIPHGQQFQPAQKQEPVVFWGVDWGRNGDLSCAVISRRTSDGNREILAVEYGPTIAPPQRKPLTDEEIDALEWPPSGTATVRDLVRLIEAAHGIKENT